MNKGHVHLRTMKHERNKASNRTSIRGFLFVVRERGVEPPRPKGHWHLKPARLPFRHSRIGLTWQTQLKDGSTKMTWK